MDAGKYKRAVEINKTIEDLQEFLSKVSTRGAWLNFSYGNGVSTHDSFSEWEIKPVNEILKIHQHLVLSDIRQAIKNLEKEIEEL